jgi:hypothetical protein
LKYHPVRVGFLTSAPDRGVGQRLVGSLTGAVASQRVTEAPNGSLRPVGNRLGECKGTRELDCDTDGWSRRESGA